MNISFTYNTNRYFVSFCANHRQTKITKEALSAMLFDEHKSVKEIAEIYQTQNQWIYELIKRFGLQPPRTIINNNLEQNIPAHIDEGKKLSILSELAKKSKSSVEKWIKNNYGKTSQQIRKDKLIEMINSDLTDEQIAKRLNLSVIYVQQMRYKINPSKRNPNKQARMKIVTEELSKGMSIAEIEKKHGISKWTISRYKQQLKMHDKGAGEDKNYLC